MNEKFSTPILAIIEAAHQNAKEYRITEENTPFHKLVIAMEELGEVSKALQDNNRREIIAELCDTCIVLFMLLRHYGNYEEIIYYMEKSLQKKLNNLDSLAN